MKITVYDSNGNEIFHFIEARYDPLIDAAKACFISDDKIFYLMEKKLKELVKTKCHALGITISNEIIEVAF